MSQLVIVADVDSLCMYYSLVFASIPRVHLGCVMFVAAAAVAFAQVSFLAFFADGLANLCCAGVCRWFCPPSSSPFPPVVDTRRDICDAL